MQELQRVPVFRHDVKEGLFCGEATEPRVPAHDDHATTLPSDGRACQGHSVKCVRDETEPETVRDRQQGDVRNGGKDS